MRRLVAASVSAVVLAVSISAGFTLVIFHEERGQLGRLARQNASEQAIIRSCDYLQKLLAVPQPPADPSRPGQLFDRQVHATWAGLYRDLGCQGRR